MIATVLMLVPSALAYEVDNLTDRHLPLADVTAPLSAEVDRVLAEVVAEVNAQTACALPEAETRQALARAIYDEMAADELVPGRSGLRALGFDRYSAWVEKGDLPRRDFHDRRDIYGSLTTLQHMLLRWAGVCATVRVGDVLVGTDKFDHFFEEGFDSWRHADFGATPHEAHDFGVRTELSIYGLQASGAFSFADLQANHDGYRFYDGLLREGSVLRRGDDGCVVQVRPFSWGEWVTWRYDEVMNPSVHTERVQEGVTEHLETHRDAYCASYAVWGGAPYEAHLAAVLKSPPLGYLTEDAPLRSDPYRLRDLCSADADAGL